MVKELGTFFEEFVRVYLHVVEECQVVEVDYPFKITPQDYQEVLGKRRQSYWSDVDVLGIKGNDVHLISCTESIVTEKQVDRIHRQLKFAERAMRRKFPEKNIITRIACISKHEKLENVEVTYFKDMLDALKKSLRNRNPRDQHVNYPFEWLIRTMDVVGCFIKREEAHKIYKFPSKKHIVSRTTL